MYETLSKALAVYSLLIIVVGTAGNLLTGIVCFKQTKLRSVPTFVFMGCMAFIDMLSLYWINFDYFYLTFFNQDLTETNVFHCKFLITLNGVLFQAGAWVLAAMSIERALSAWITKWRTTIFNSKRAFIVCALIIFAMCCEKIDFAFGFYWNDKFEDSTGLNKSSLFRKCTSNPYLFIRSNAFTYLYSIVPFCLLIISNGFLIISMLRRGLIKRSQKDRTRRKKTSVCVIVTSLFFIVFTSPEAIIKGYFSKPYYTELEIFVMFLVSELSYTYHALNFAVFITINKKFRTEFLDFLLCRNKRKFN